MLGKQNLYRDAFIRAWWTKLRHCWRPEASADKNFEDSAALFLEL